MGPSLEDVDALRNLDVGGRWLSLGVRRAVPQEMMSFIGDEPKINVLIIPCLGFDFRFVEHIHLYLHRQNVSGGVGGRARRKGVGGRDDLGSECGASQPASHLQQPKNVPSVFVYSGV